MEIQLEQNLLNYELTNQMFDHLIRNNQSDQEQQYIHLITDQNSNDNHMVLEFDETVHRTQSQDQNKIMDVANNFSQDISLVASSEEGQYSSDGSVSVNGEHFKNILTRYQKQLQIRIKRVKQTIKKGQHIRQKKLFFQPINDLFLYNIKLDHKIIIFGYMLIEDNFRDYDSQYDSNLINQFDQYIRLLSIEKDNANQLFTFHLMPTLDNVMKKFNQMTNYYQNSSDQQFKLLSDQLKNYEQFIQNIDLKYKTLYEKYSKEDIDNYMEIYFSEAIKFVKSASADEFLTYNMFQYNMKGKQLEPIKNGVSYAMMNLLGIQVEQIENMLKKINSFMDPCGKNRMDSIIKLLQFMNSEKDILSNQKGVIRSIDSLNIYNTYDIFYFNTDSIPSEVNEILRHQCVIQKYYIDITEIEKIIILRGQEIQDIYRAIHNEDNIHIENTILTEVFLEKYYPDTFQKLKGDVFKQEESPSSLSV